LRITVFPTSAEKAFFNRPAFTQPTDPGMDEPSQPVSGDGAAEQPFSCPECDRTVGRANVLTGDFSFESVTPISSSPDGSPEFRETGLEDGPQKAIELRCDHCGAEFTLGVETNE
jgi:hypothetical protein